MSILTLYHTGFEKIRRPDVHYGRKNADFGQGFYLSSGEDFSRRWARTRKGMDTYLNVYELDLDGLNVKRFERDGEWFDYIYQNRAGAADSLPEYDVIIGPIANDTIYDTYGLMTGGMIPRELTLKLLLIGPCYEQITLKTERAAEALRFVSSRIIPRSEVESFREEVRTEEKEYQDKFFDIINSME